MTTSTDICNMALDILKEAPITALTDTRPIAMWLNRNFDTTRDSLLEEADWNFAIVRDQIAKDGTDPDFGWDYQYTLPSDCIRLIPLTKDGEFEGRPVHHVVEGGKILTDEESPLNVRYVSRHETYSSWPASLIEALSARLAMKMAHWLTGKSNYVQVAEGMYRDAMRRAWASDAMQGTPPRAADEEWTDAR